MPKYMWGDLEADSLSELRGLINDFLRNEMMNMDGVRSYATGELVDDLVIAIDVSVTRESVLASLALVPDDAG